MTEEVNSITPWIPIVGTLLGATLGFAASAINSKFSNDRKEKTDKKQRDRGRVEKIFRLLVAINSERTQEMSDIINYIHNSIPIENKGFQDFPPLHELEMLITLYFPSLENERLELMSRVQAYGKSYLDFRMKSYVSSQKEVKKKDCGVLMTLESKTYDQISLIKESLKKYVEA
jgi:hypothetical protein